MGDCDKSHQPEQNNKRRSELFHRRSNIKSAANRTDNDTTENCNSTNEKNQDSSELSEEPFDLSKHIKTLNNEQDMWKKEYEQRRAKRKLKKQEANTKCVASLDLLSESERNFLLARPDYTQLSQNIKKLQPIATHIACLNTEISHRSETLIHHMEEKIRLTAERIAKLSKTQA